MPEFRWLTDAYRWCLVNAWGKCTVVIHGDPYLWQLGLDKHMELSRLYTASFYERAAVYIDEGMEPIEHKFTAARKS